MRLSGHFQTCLFFFMKRFCVHKNAKQTTFTLLEVFACKKLLPLLISVCLILFCWLMFASECFCACKIFSKKKQNRFEIILITSFYCTTDVYRQPLTLVIFPLVQVPFMLLGDFCKLNKTPSDGTCLGRTSRR